MNRILMQALVEYAVFLGLSEDDVLDPDIAVAQLEQLTWMLKGLSAPEREVLTRFIEEMVITESQDPGSSKERTEFISSLPEELRLRD